MRLSFVVCVRHCGDDQGYGFAQAEQVLLISALLFIHGSTDACAALSLTMNVHFV